MGKDLKGRKLEKGISQRKDERYMIRLTVDGVRYTEYSNTYGKDRDNDALKIKARMLLKNRGIIANSNNNKDITLNQWFDTWLKVCKKNQTKLSTNSVYYSIYNSHIKDKLGRYYLKQITPLLLKQYFNELQINPKTGKSVPKRVKIVLMNMFVYAVEYNIIETNPVEVIKIREKKNTVMTESGQHAEFKYLTVQERQIFFTNYTNKRHENLLLVCLHTGLRSGELCNLRMSDIDLTNREIHVCKQLVMDVDEDNYKRNYNMIVSDTKGSNKRIIPIDDVCHAAIIDEIKYRKTVLSKEDKYNDLLFLTRNMTPYKSAIINTSIQNRVNILRKEGHSIKDFTVHCLRHTFATTCLEAGIPIEVVQYYLGHANIGVTTKYAKVTKELRNKELKKLDAFYKQENKENGVKMVSNRYLVN